MKGERPGIRFRPVEPDCGGFRGVPTESPKKSAIKVRCTREFKVAIIRAAAAQGMLESDWVREILTRALIPRP